MPRPHNLLFVIESLNVGGSENFLKNLALGLDRTKFNPLVCCLVEKGKLAEPLEKAGIRVVSMGWRRGSMPSTAGVVFRLARLMSREKVDLVQTLFYRPEILAALASFFVPGTVLVASQQDVIVPEGSASRLLLKLSRLRVKHVIANCETCARHRRSLTSHRPEQVSAIHIGLVHEESLLPASEQVRNDIDALFSRGPVVTFAGRLHRVKGPDVFVRAAADLVRKRPTVSFLLIGEGPMAAELAEEVARLGLAESIMMPGHVPSLFDVLRRSAVFVCSSRTEGFPTAVLEAMAAGAPVIATNVGGVPELIEDRVNGFLFESEDHGRLATLIEGLLLDRETARAVAAKAREKVERDYKFEDTVRLIQDLYLRLLRGGTGEQRREGT